MFRVVVLGSGASLPTLHRGPAAVAVQIGGDVHLLDCGEGTQLQWRRAGLRFGRLRSICISHLHGDHLNGLIGLLQTLSLNDRKDPLSLFGPPGLAEYLAVVRRVQGVRLAYPVEVVEAEGGVIAERSDHRIECAALDHGTPTLGYALVERDRPGRFDVDAARRLGIEPGPDYGRLQHGDPVVAPDGRIVTPGDVLGSSRPGRRVVYCVDTRPCESAVQLANAASLFICDSTFDDELQVEAAARGHSTARQAAEMASRARVERLLLTHVSARYHDPRPLLQQAREVFAAAEVASDLMEVEL